MLAKWPALLASTNLGMDGHDDGLERGDPEGPDAAKALGEDGNDALHRAEDGTMDDHGPRHLQRTDTVRHSYVPATTR